MNKNTRKLKKLLRKSNPVIIEIPVLNYHSVKALTSQTRATGSGLVSRAPKRNMQQRVLHNPGATLTVHEPIDKERPVDFKNHRYMKEDKHFVGYRQPYEKQK